MGFTQVFEVPTAMGTTYCVRTLQQNFDEKEKENLQSFTATDISFIYAPFSEPA
jgi:hypothetical protein